MVDRVDKIMSEFASVELGDERLDRRLGQLAAAMAEDPARSFPQALDSAGVEAAYRFFRNGRVTFEKVIESHRQQTVRRAGQLGEVVVAHDTSEFRFEGKSRRNLGMLGTAGQGFLAHVALAVTPDTRDPIGVMHVETWARTKTSVSKRRQAGELSYTEARRSPQSESRRWERGVEEVEQRVANVTTVIHVMDSEADDYLLLSQLQKTGRRFIVRLGYNRLVDDEGVQRRVRELADATTVVAEREVDVSPRKKPIAAKDKRRTERAGRTANLAISATRLTLCRPSKRAEVDGPKTLPINVVYVRELDAPDGVDGVEWILMTSEPIAGAADLLRVVDMYRARWVIEEYFKALKTGCAIEARQLESFETLLVAFGLFIPIAWVLLRLRTLARQQDPVAAETVLTATQIKVLTSHHRSKLTSSEPTVRDALLAIARLGGHLRSNGQPGWMVLCRGYATLLRLEEGYRLAAPEEM